MMMMVMMGFLLPYRTSMVLEHRVAWVEGGVEDDDQVFGNRSESYPLNR